jgi:hypothetical protein
MKRLNRIAARVAMPMVLKDQLKTLDDLADLSDNIEDMVDMFGRHFRIAARLDTDVKSQFELLKKAQKGLEAAQNTQKYLEMVLREYPDDKTALRATKDAMVMVKRFQKHEQDARKVVSTISKKEMPPALAKYAGSVVRALKARLVDPKALRVIPWQKKDYRGGIQYQMVVKIPAPELNLNRGVYSLSLVESTSTNEGPGVDRGSGYPKMETPKQVADRMAEVLIGWPGLKGETDAIAEREETARGVQSAMNSAIRRMRPWMQEDAEVETGNARVHGSYRSTLPKEGDRDSGHDRYRDMVDDEIKKFKSVIEPLLKPYAKAIKNVEYYDGEKSWIYVSVDLK